jgi:hypothetical protein
VSVWKLLQDRGVKEAEVIPEDGVQALRLAEDWSTMVAGKGRQPRRVGSAQLAEEEEAAIGSQSRVLNDTRARWQNPKLSG